MEARPEGPGQAGVPAPHPVMVELRVELRVGAVKVELRAELWPKLRVELWLKVKLWVELRVELKLKVRVELWLKLRV